MSVGFKQIVGSAVFAAGLLLLAVPSQASAQDAAPQNPCTGPSPVAGVEIRGPVLHVIDGQTICVALGFETDAWIRLKLADAPVAKALRKTSNTGQEPDPRGALMQAALAKMATCRTIRDQSGGVAALCEVDGKPLGELLRDPNVVAASYAWR